MLLAVGCEGAGGLTVDVIDEEEKSFDSGGGSLYLYTSPAHKINLRALIRS